MTPAIRRSALFAFFFLFALIALLPLRLAIDWLGFARFGLAAREATGSVWLGGLSEAQLGPAPIGDVEIRLNRLPLLIGRTRLSIERHDPDLPLSGALSRSGDGFSLDDFTGRLRLGGALFPLPLGGVDADDVTISFAGGLCRHAEGRVRAQLAGQLPGLSPGAGLSGTARCSSGRALLPLATQSGLEQLNISFAADGHYRAELLLRPSDPRLRAQLIAAGFAPSGNALSRRADGSF